MNKTQQNNLPSKNSSGFQGSKSPNLTHKHHHHQQDNQTNASSRNLMNQTATASAATMVQTHMNVTGPINKKSSKNRSPLTQSQPHQNLKINKSNNQKGDSRNKQNHSVSLKYQTQVKWHKQQTPDHNNSPKHNRLESSPSPYPQNFNSPQHSNILPQVGSIHLDSKSPFQPTASNKLNVTHANTFGQKQFQNHRLSPTLQSLETQTPHIASKNLTQMNQQSLEPLVHSNMYDRKESSRRTTNASFLSGLRSQFKVIPDNECTFENFSLQTLEQQTKFMEQSTPAQIKKWDLKMEQQRQEAKKQAHTDALNLKKQKIARKRKYQSLFSQKAINRIDFDDRPDLDKEEVRLGPSPLMSSVNREMARAIMRKRGTVSPPNFTKQQIKIFFTIEQDKINFGNPLDQKQEREVQDDLLQYGDNEAVQNIRNCSNNTLGRLRATHLKKTLTTQPTKQHVTDLTTINEREILAIDKINTLPRAPKISGLSSPEKKNFFISQSQQSDFGSKEEGTEQQTESGQKPHYFPAASHLDQYLPQQNFLNQVSHSMIESPKATEMCDVIFKSGLRNSQLDDTNNDEDDDDQPLEPDINTLDSRTISPARLNQRLSSLEVSPNRSSQSSSSEDQLFLPQITADGQHSQLQYQEQHVQYQGRYDEGIVLGNNFNSLDRSSGFSTRNQHYSNNIFGPGRCSARNWNDLDQQTGIPLDPVRYQLKRKIQLNKSMNVDKLLQRQRNKLEEAKMMKPVRVSQKPAMRDAGKVDFEVAFGRVTQKEREQVRRIVEMKEKDGTDLSISKTINHKIKQRIKVQDALGIMCNHEELWVGFATDDQMDRLKKLLSKQYGWDETPKQVFDSEGKPISTQGQSSKIPPHEHTVENCKRFGCTYLKDQLKNLTKGEKLTKDIVNKFKGYLNRLLLSMTFDKDAPPQVRTMYNLYLKSLEEDAQQELTFYERQEIDAIVKAGKDEIDKKNKAELNKSPVKMFASAIANQIEISSQPVVNQFAKAFGANLQRKAMFGDLEAAAAESLPSPVGKSPLKVSVNNDKNNDDRDPIADLHTSLLGKQIERVNTQKRSSFLVNSMRKDSGNGSDSPSLNQPPDHGQLLKTDFIKQSMKFITGEANSIGISNLLPEDVLQEALGKYSKMDEKQFKPLKQVRSERIKESAKNLGIPEEYAKKVDQIINRREYDKEQALQGYLNEIIDEAEEILSQFSKIDENDKVGLHTYQNQIGGQMNQVIRGIDTLEKMMWVQNNNSDKTTKAKQVKPQSEAERQEAELLKRKKEQVTLAKDQLKQIESKISSAELLYSGLAKQPSRKKTNASQLGTTLSSLFTGKSMTEKSK